MKKKVFKIKNMHCASCAMIIESDLEDAGFKAKCSYAKQILEVENYEETHKKKIEKIVKNAGYVVEN